MKQIIGVMMMVGSFLANTAPTQAEENEAYRKAINDPAAANLARPNAAQYNYHEMGRIQFVAIDPCTWQGRDYDNHTTDLKDMKLPNLDTDQWCRAAKSWGAKEILFVAKHTGGFCWWQTDTTDYSVKSIAWKDGKGDVLKELSESCKKFGLKLGVYVYPGDTQWGAGISSGGKTDDPAKQEGYNKVLRQQWTEVLSNYGEISEVWFDGGIVVPIDDVILKYAPDAVMFGGKRNIVRWPGSESGILPYPAWNSYGPDGKLWAPFEADTTLYDHFWFWSQAGEEKRKSLPVLLNIFYKSVGRGGMLLLNSTPNTDGLIPEGDMEHYKKFGDEIERRFAHPLGTTNGIGSEHTIRFDGPKKLNQVVMMEDYRHGERIRKYILEGKTKDGSWRKLNSGSAVGRKRIVVFKPISVSQLRLRIVESIGQPLLRLLEAYYVEGMDTTYLTDEDLAVSSGKPATASAVHSPPYTADKINDGDRYTRWGADDPTKACWIEIDLLKVETIDRTEIYELADRILKFQVEYRNAPDEDWKVCLEGDTVGAEYKKEFDSVSGRYFRLNILEASFAPTIWEFRLLAVESPGVVCHNIEPAQFTDGQADLLIDLSEYFTKPGQYDIEIIPDDGIAGLEACAFQPLYDGVAIRGELFSEVIKGRYYNINRTEQIVAESKITLQLSLKALVPEKATGVVLIHAPNY